MRKSTLTSTNRLQREERSSPAKQAGEGIANLIVTGASAGGHQALIEILKNLSHDLPAAMVILLHMRLRDDFSVQTMLGKFSRLPLIEVQTKEPLRPGFIFVLPPGRFATFGRGIIEVDQGVPDRPVTTIDRLFRSAAENYGERVIGVILTGLLKDGTEGLRAVHEAGGLTIVQDPREAEFPDMPASAMEGLPVTFA